LLFVVEAFWAAIKHGKNSVFVTWAILLRISFSAWQPYAFFSGAKHPTSSGCNKCEECGGIQRVIIFLSSQSWWNSIELWLS
jgi:hypothetical protein